MRNLLIVGSSGFLGSYFVKKFRNKYNLFAVINKSKLIQSKVTKLKLNILNHKQIYSFVKDNNIDLIINFAGLTSVEKCQVNRDKAYTSHVIIPNKLKSIAKFLNIGFVHISTDHLFDGKYKGKYSEKSKTKPLNIYAKTKLLGENKIKNYKKSLIIRTNFFGKSLTKKKTFADKILANLKKEKKIYLWNDVYFTPIYIENLVDIIEYLIRNKAKGIYNVSSNEKISKYDFGIKLSNSPAILSISVDI